MTRLEAMNRLIASGNCPLHPTLHKDSCNICWRQKRFAEEALVNDALKTLGWSGTKSQPPYFLYVEMALMIGIAVGGLVLALMGLK